MKFLRPLLVKIKLICHQPAMTRPAGVIGVLSPAVGCWIGWLGADTVFWIWCVCLVEGALTSYLQFVAVYWSSKLDNTFLRDGGTRLHLRGSVTSICGRWGTHLQSCLQAIEGEDTENPFICHIMNLLWSLSDKGTCVRFCWVPSHCGIDGNERVDQLAKETLDQDIDPLAKVHYTDMKPLVNSYIQKLVQTKWDVAVHGRDLYLVKPTLGPPKKFQHLTRAEEVVITRLRTGHTKATKSHILSRGPPTGCHHCGQTLTIDHMLLECALLQECRDEYYTVDSLNALFETIPETCIVEFLREAGFFYLIWCNLLTSISPQTFTIWSDLSNYLEN